MLDNELMLQDRIAKIQAINEQYNLLDNAYVSFSGGKDSTIVHYLIDLALPNNNIPRVFFNTGLDYKYIREFVVNLAKTDSRIQIINSGVNIKKMLETDGYPFKSKQHSHNFQIYKNNYEIISKYVDEINANPQLKNDYDYIHNLPRGVKTIIKYLFGIRERERESCISFKIVPNKLRYQFTPEFATHGVNISELCCYRMKKEPADKYERKSKRYISITGMRGDEGGMRSLNGCTIFDGDALTSFHPIKVVSEEWENWFLEKYNLQICKLYYPPFNFKRTGCKGCPFALKLRDQLDVMKKLLPNEYKQCEIIWKPVYSEYRKIKYRLKPNKEYYQMTIFDILEDKR